jgi:hypothetical protein
MDEVFRTLNHMYRVYRLNHLCLMFFEYVWDNDCPYFVNRGSKYRVGECNKKVYCLRIRQYYYEQNIYHWKYWPGVDSPRLDDPHIKAMYLDELKEKRLTFLRGTRSISSPLYRLVEPTHCKTILEFAGL